MAPEGERAEPTTDINGEVKADSSITVDVPSDSGGSDDDVVDSSRPEPAKKRREVPQAAAPPDYEILGSLAAAASAASSMTPGKSPCIDERIEIVMTGRATTRASAK